MLNNTRHLATLGEIENRKELTTCSDAELVIRVHKRGLGRKLVFNVLLGRHRERILKHCIFRLGNRHDAQDVTQQVMLRVYQSIDRFEGRSAFRTWLYTITENQCRSFAVKRMRYVQTEHIESLIDVDYEGNCNSVPERCARDQAVDIALARVSDKSREVLLLRFFQDYSLEVIASMLEISLSAAKMRLYRGVQQFNVQFRELVGIQHRRV